MKFFCLSFVFLLFASTAFAEQIGVGDASTSVGKGCNSLFVGALSMLDREYHYKISYDEKFRIQMSDVLFCDDDLEIRGNEMIDVAKLMAERFSECVGLKINEKEKTLFVEYRDALIPVSSTHKTVNSYSVNGKEIYTFPNEEQKDRLICLHNKIGAPPWVLEVAKALGR